MTIVLSTSSSRADLVDTCRVQQLRPHMHLAMLLRMMTTRPLATQEGQTLSLPMIIDEEITGQMTQSGKHEQPAETIPQPAPEKPPIKRRRGRPRNANKPPKAAISRGRGRGRMVEEFFRIFFSGSAAIVCNFSNKPTRKHTFTC